MRSLAIAIALCVGLAPLCAAAQTEHESAEAAAVDGYKLHMKNGVKLFQDKNFEAAIVEFQAAYEASPKPSPLFNIALCEKALFDYPKAIGVLEQAVARHGAAMDEADKKAAIEAIDEMRALLAYVTVKITPPQATLRIDGDEKPPGAADRPIPLGPGTHTISAASEGYAIGEATITVASGETDKVVTLSLVPDKGYVTITTHDAAMAIAVDGKPMGYGQWAGLLPPGSHIVQMYKSDSPTVSRQILVVAGKAQEVGPDLGGVAITAPAPALPPRLPDVPKAPVTEPPAAPVRGFFALATGSLLGPVSHPTGFPGATANSGAAGGVRVGYRVNRAAAFNATFEYGNVVVRASDVSDDSDYSLSSTRFGLDLRLMTPGKTVRFVGTVGGGAVSTDLTFDLTSRLATLCDGAVSGCDFPRLEKCEGDGCSGLDPYFQSEVGIELEFGGVLLGAALQSYFQATKGIDESPYDNDALVFLGGGLRVGYGAW